jgi:hypothetical protein
MSSRSSSSKDDFSSNSPSSFGSFVGSEGGLGCYSSLGKGLGIWLHPTTVMIAALLIKHLLLSLPGNKIVAVVPGDVLEL